MPHGVPIGTIITHVQPHLDELVAIFLLRRYGETAFPGVGQAKVEFLGTGGAMPDGRTAEEYEANGTLLIGIGRGRFDEHPAPGRPRLEGETATSLIAKELGIADAPEVKPLVEYTNFNDLKGRVHDYELGELIRKLNRSQPDNPHFVLEMAMTLIAATCDQQYRFHHVAPQIVRDAEVLTLPSRRVSLKVIKVQADDDQVKGYAFSKGGGHAAVVVQRQSDGHIQVFTNAYYGLDLAPAIRAIRLAELEAAGLTPDPSTNYRVEGNTADVPAWHYFKKGKMLLNGSATAPDVPVTKLSLDTVTALVIQALTPRPRPQRRPQG